MSALFGCWLAASPWTLGYQLERGPTGNALGVGISLAIFNLVSACRLTDQGQEIFNILMGVWLLLSPALFGYGGHAAWNIAAVGLLIAGVATWQIREALRRP